jgi:hypothetical protein
MNLAYLAAMSGRRRKGIKGRSMTGLENQDLDLHPPRQGWSCCLPADLGFRWYEPSEVRIALSCRKACASQDKLCVTKCASQDELCVTKCASQDKLCVTKCASQDQLCVINCASQDKLCVIKCASQDELCVTK